MKQNLNIHEVSLKLVKSLKSFCHLVHIVLETIVIIDFFIVEKKIDNVILECGLTIIISNILR